MLKAIKSMANVKILSNKESMAIKGGLGYCTANRQCPAGTCCNLQYGVCEKGGSYGGCTTP